MLGLMDLGFELSFVRVVLCCVVMRVVFLTLDFSNPHLCKNTFYCNIQDKKQRQRQRQDIRPTALHTKTQVMLLYNMDFKKSSLVPG